MEHDGGVGKSDGRNKRDDNDGVDAGGTDDEREERINFKRWRCNYEDCNEVHFIQKNIGVLWNRHLFLFCGKRE